MKFFPASVDENFPLMHMVSEDGFWEIGYVPMIFGVRVRIGRVGEPYVLVDYCAGDTFDGRSRLLLLCLTLLEGVDEVVSDQRILELFPFEKIKPIFNDSLWEILKAAAISQNPAVGPLLNL